METGKPPGPVRLSHLGELVGRGFVVVIVSESVNCIDLPIEHVIVPGNRLQALLNARARHPNMGCVYVSDNPGDDDNARKAGCEYVHPSNWLVFLQTTTKP
ncbi:MAG: hypothetical protein RXR18_05620 [Nitrososphaeria archaeon]